MAKRIAIIGGGINGLVCAFYLRRAGFEVTIFERASQVGGACVAESVEIDGKRYEYTSGATVLGVMQRFVFEETGLAERLTVHAPEHHKMVWFDSLGDKPFHYYRYWTDSGFKALQEEFRRKWGERGDLAGWEAGEAKVVGYLRDEIRAGRPPDLDRAWSTLGPGTTQRWITGSARRLLDHYLTSDYAKIYFGLSVNESGPVSIDAPMSAFSIPLMVSGSVFDGIGRWGFVKGRLWALTRALGEILREMGVRIELDAEVWQVAAERAALVCWSRDKAGGYTSPGHAGDEPFDHVVLATDACTSHRLLWMDKEAERLKVERPMLGSAGKLICLFRKPIRWKGDLGLPDFETAFRFAIQVDTLDEWERRAQAIRSGKTDYLPSSVQYYCDGAAMRKMGVDRGYESLTMFVHELGLTRPGAEMPPYVTQVLMKELASRIENPEDVFWTKLLSPVDVRDTFLFPGGNYDGLELTDGQQFHSRTFSADPKRRFFMFRDLETVSTCHASVAYGGSIAGTNGWLCASEILRFLRP